jgi:hypothetical protein
VTSLLDSIDRLTGPTADDVRRQVADATRPLDAAAQKVGPRPCRGCSLARTSAGLGGPLAPCRRRGPRACPCPEPLLPLLPTPAAQVRDVIAQVGDARARLAPRVESYQAYAYGVSPQAGIPGATQEARRVEARAARVWVPRRARAAAKQGARQPSVVVVR